MKLAIVLSLLVLAFLIGMHHEEVASFLTDVSAAVSPYAADAISAIKNSLPKVSIGG